MSDKGIIFSAPMVRALLEGRKTQTRRLAKFVEQQPNGDWHCRGNGGGMMGMDEAQVREWGSGYAPYAPGDRLYVREAYYQFGYWEPVPDVRTKTGRMKWRFIGDPDRVQFDAPADHRKGRHHKDPGTPAWHKRLGRFMPRNLSRLWLDVTDVRVQRVQDISTADCHAEGAITDEWMDWREDVSNIGMPAGSTIESERDVFRELWDSLHNKPGERWDDNPWIVAVSFEVNRGNIDSGELN